MTKRRHIEYALAAILLACSCAAEVDGPEVGVTQQELTTHVYPPSGWLEGRIYVGLTTGGALYVVYRNGLSGGGNCTWTQIGTSSGLYNRTRVYGSGWGDEAWVLGPGESQGVCGTTLIATPPSMKLELDMGDGHDFVQSKAYNANLQVYLRAGNDFAVVGDAWWVFGGGGDDTTIGLIAENAYMLGEDGGDLCCGFSNAFACDGGATALDAQYGAWIILDNVESEATLNDCKYWRDVVYARIGD